MLIDKTKVSKLVYEEFADSGLIKTMANALSIITIKVIVRYFDCKTLDELGDAVSKYTKEEFNSLTDAIGKELGIILMEEIKP